MSLFVDVLCFSVIFGITHSFYLSLHALEWLNASNYCQSYCASHLASIHSQQDHLTTLSLIDHNPNVYTRVWLGLNDIGSSDIWSWDDASLFDFGGIKDLTTGRVIRGTYPWRSDEPDYNDSDECVALEVGSNYIGSNSRSWVDRKLTANYHFFCNDCSSKLHKYAAINGARNYTEAETICQDKFGTSLASIHSDDDMMEARTVCKELTSSNGCWIGLNDRSENQRVYEWTDGTKWDYGNVLHAQPIAYPWYNSEPGSSTDQLCIFLDPSNGNDPGEYLWDDYWCHSKKPRALCNAPSEICDGEQFAVMKGHTSDWVWGTKPCTLVKTVVEVESIAILGNKQYLNSNGVLSIDLMYSITHIGLHGNAGIALYLDESNCNDYYYIGVWAGHDMIFIGKSVNSEWVLISHTTITPTENSYVMGELYNLKIVLTQGTQWEISLNGHSQLQVTDNAFENENNKLSGYVSIRNVNAGIDVRSLFISGEVQYFDDNVWYKQCTLSPTMAPTLSSISPTVSPTMAPTTAPSNAPTSAPTTLSPTDSPSNSPTIEPTHIPTNIPTIEPTVYPSQSPTHNTRFPSTGPTQMPSKPTNKPTIEPTYTQPTKLTDTDSETSLETTTLNPTSTEQTRGQSEDIIIPVLEENRAIKQNRNQLIWIIGIPIGLAMFCFFGIYLVYIYYKEEHQKQSQKRKMNSKVTGYDNEEQIRNMKTPSLSLEESDSDTSDDDTNTKGNMDALGLNVTDENDLLIDDSGQSLEENNNKTGNVELEMIVANDDIIDTDNGNAETVSDSDEYDSADGNMTVPLNYRMKQDYTKY